MKQKFTIMTQYIRFTKSATPGKKQKQSNNKILERTVADLTHLLKEIQGRSRVSNFSSNLFIKLGTPSSIPEKEKKKEKKRKKTSETEKKKKKKKNARVIICNIRNNVRKMYQIPLPPFHPPHPPSPRNNFSCIKYQEQRLYIDVAKSGKHTSTQNENTHPHKTKTHIHTKRKHTSTQNENTHPHKKKTNNGNVTLYPTVPQT